MDQNGPEQKQSRVSEIEGQVKDLQSKAANAEGGAKAEYEEQMKNLQNEKNSLSKDIQGFEGIRKDIGGLHL